MNTESSSELRYSIFFHEDDVYDLAVSDLNGRDRSDLESHTETHTQINLFKEKVSNMKKSAKKREEKSRNE